MVSYGLKHGPYLYAFWKGNTPFSFFYIRPRINPHLKIGCFEFVLERILFSTFSFLAIN